MTVLTLSCICCILTPEGRVTVGFAAIFQQKEVARVMKRHDDYGGSPTRCAQHMLDLLRYY